MTNPSSTDLLVDGFGRVHGIVHAAVDTLSVSQLAFRADSEANSIGWLVWHLTRVQDDHIADVAGTEQVWDEGGWASRFGLPAGDDATGYGQSSSDVGSLVGDQVTHELLTAYYDATHQRTLDYLAGLTDSDLARVVDTRWDPPVTLAARLVSVLSDDLQHAGQASFVRGLVERAEG